MSGLYLRDTLGWSTKQFTAGGVKWVRLYYRGRYVAQFRQGKKYLVHYITGKRFASINKAIEFYGSQPDLLRRYDERPTPKLSTVDPA